MAEGSSLKSLFAQHHRGLLRFLRQKFRERSDVEDIAQDAYLNMLGKNSEELENARAYLFTTAHNLALNRINRERTHASVLRKEKVHNDSIEQGTASLECAISAHQNLVMIEAALKTLPEKYKTTFTLSRVQGLSYREISQATGTPVSTIEKHIIKVLRHLKQVVPDET